MRDWLSQPGLLWIAAAALLGLAELATPGLFLIFFAIAAAVTGMATLALPDLPLWGQIGAFAAWSAVSVLIGRRWYLDYPVGTSAPQLNDRAAQLVGRIVTVEQPFAGGRGRVRVGDGAWPARGPDLAAGEQARVIGHRAGELIVERSQSGQ